jgi:hypothetical protein
MVRIFSRRAGGGDLAVFFSAFQVGVFPDPHGVQKRAVQIENGISDHASTISLDNFKSSSDAAFASFCAKMAETTATPAMPLPARDRMFYLETPPIATTGSDTVRQISESVSNETESASFFVPVG